MNQEKAEGLEEEGSILIWLTGFAFIAAMAAIFLFVPTEKTEGPIQRIMYPVSYTHLRGPRDA